MDTLRNLKIVKKFKQITSSNAVTDFVGKFVVIFVIWVLALIPIWVYTFFRWLIEPTGFWQELALFGVAFIVIGWLQVILLVFGFALTAIALSDDSI